MQEVAGQSNFYVIRKDIMELGPTCIASIEHEGSGTLIYTFKTTELLQVVANEFMPVVKYMRYLPVSGYDSLGETFCKIVNTHSTGLQEGVQSILKNRVIRRLTQMYPKKIMIEEVSEELVLRLIAGL